MNKDNNYCDNNILQYSKNGDLNKVKKLIDLGFDINDQDEDGKHELSIACREGQIENIDSIEIIDNNWFAISNEFKFYLWILPLPIMFVILAGISNSIMDTLAYHFSTSIFANFDDQSYWNPNISWKNKWKNGNPEEGEAYFGSSTFLVWTTDAWHIFKSCWINLLLLALITTSHGYVNFITNHTPKCALYKYSILTFIILRLFLTCTFELFWSQIWPLK
jgi:hypothetical protein